MRPTGILGAVATAVVLAWGFAVMVPRTPGGYVALLAAGTFGMGAFYGRPTAAVLAHPWRRHHRLRRFAEASGTLRLSRLLTRLGWNGLIRRPVRGRADLPQLREDAVGALLSHTLSMVFHLVAALGLVLRGNPVWATAAVGLGLLLHAWPALLQVHVLGRVDELQARS